MSQASTTKSSSMNRNSQKNSQKNNNGRRRPAKQTFDCDFCKNFDQVCKTEGCENITFKSCAPCRAKSLGLTYDESNPPVVNDRPLKTVVRPYCYTCFNKMPKRAVNRCTGLPEVQAVPHLDLEAIKAKPCNEFLGGSFTHCKKCNFPTEGDDSYANRVAEIEKRTRLIAAHEVEIAEEKRKNRLSEQKVVVSSWGNQKPLVFDTFAAPKPVDSVTVIATHAVAYGSTEDLTYCSDEEEEEIDSYHSDQDDYLDEQYDDFDVEDDE